MLSKPSIYKIAAQRRRNAQELTAPKFINDAYGNLLNKDDDICNRWKEYGEVFLNEEFPRTTFRTCEPNHEDVPDISSDEVEFVIKQMKCNKAAGPDKIPAEFWKAVGVEGILFLVTLFNKILRDQPLPEDFRMSFFLPFYKQKGDARCCGNYRAIKLMSHTMKILERVMCNRLRALVTVSDDQCGFVEGKSTTDAIQSLRIMMEKHRDARKDLHLVFIDLEKAFDRIPRDLIWCALRMQNVPEIYVQVIQDMYHNVRTKIRCTAGTSDEFNVRIGVHQGSVLSPLLFISVIWFLTRSIDIPSVWALLFADDIVLASEFWQALQQALDAWQFALEGSGLKISGSKTLYMECKFADQSRPSQDLFLSGQALPKCDQFKYLGSVVTNTASCEEDVNHRINVAWLKWRENSSIFCDRKMPPKMKGKMH